MSDRRTVLLGIAATGAALTIAPVLATPPVFDATAYIRDLRATGVVIEVYGDMVERGCALEMA